MFLAAIGTRTFRNKDATVTIVPPDVEFQPTEDMQLILGVRDIVLHFPVDGAISADIQIFAGEFKTAFNALPNYVMDVDGIVKEVARVEFADGSKWPDWEKA